jgi:uncharacterized membrane protein YhaH (DUF805 family)
MVDAQRRFWRKYLVFKGRASRSEFWWWMLVFTAAGVLLSLVNRELVRPLGAVPGTDAVLAYSLKTGVLSTLWSLINFVGGIAVTVRRLHDTNRSGSRRFVQVIIGVGSIVMIVLTALPTRPAGRRFDPPPAPAAR